MAIIRKCDLRPPAPSPAPPKKPRAPRPAPLPLQDAAKLYRVGRRAMAAICRRGEFGAREIKGAWVLTNPPTREQCIRPLAVAETVNSSVQFIRRLCVTGRIKAIRIGKQWRISLPEATRFHFLYLTGERAVDIWT